LASTTSTNGGRPVPPAQLYGALFAAVQEAGLFADSKTFADAVPLRDPAAIVAAYAREAPGDAEALRHFVAANFALPEEPATAARPGAPATTLAEEIAARWSRLERGPVAASGSALAVSQRHVVPGGRFRELYYWDSYFTMLGLARDSRQDLVEEMVDLFAGLIEQFGHVPNGTRTYYLSRSQPPVFYLMVGLSQRQGDPRLIAAMRREHAYWMTGGRVVRMPDDSLLNRFWDDRDGPRDESWAEDVATARLAPRPANAVWRDIRAGAESGWDFSSRWLADAGDIATIRTTRVVPCCLNALLPGLESALAEAGQANMALAAERRRAAMARYCWNGAEGFYADWLIDAGMVSASPTAAMLYPLFTGCAGELRARRTIAAARRDLLAPGGLRTTRVASGQQWDAPNGWAPLQWIACEALERHGEPALAAEIARRWTATVTREFAASGRLLEKYDVESGGGGGGGEYGVQEGFGWTNGVTRALMARYGQELEA